MVQSERLGHGGLHAHYRESHLADEKLKNPMLELEELTCAVGRFAQRNNAAITDNIFQRLKIPETMPRFHRLEGESR